MNVLGTTYNNGANNRGKLLMLLDPGCPLFTRRPINMAGAIDCRLLVDN